MRMTICDGCQKQIDSERNNASLYHPRMFTITERPHTSPYTHTFFDPNENSYVKHFCSEECIREFYNNNKK